MFLLLLELSVIAEGNLELIFDIRLPSDMQDAHHTIIDDYEIIVDYSRQQLMPGWIPRRLG